MRGVPPNLMGHKLAVGPNLGGSGGMMFSLRTDRSVPRFSIEDCVCSGGIVRIFEESFECSQCLTQFCQCGSRCLLNHPCLLKMSYYYLPFQSYYRLTLESSPG